MYKRQFGELNVEEVEGTPGCSDFTECNAQNAFVVVTFCIYIFISNIMLVNLLVAMLGYTYNEVQEISQKVWAFNRFDLIREFYSRAVLPPPLNIPVLLLKLVRYLIYRCNYPDTIAADLLSNDEFSEIFFAVVVVVVFILICV